MNLEAIPPLLRGCRRRLAVWTDDGPPAAPGNILREHTRRFVLTQGLVHAFYAFLLYLAFSQMTEIPLYAALSTFRPLWPIWWLRHQDPAAIQGLFLFFLGTSLLAAVLPGWRTARVLAFLGVLEFVALKNSYGKIGHSNHLPLLVALGLVFLPRGWERPAPRTTRALRQGTLLVFWLCGAAVLLTYTMSGLGKLGGALYQLACLEPNAFAPGALGMHIAQRLLQTDSHSLFGAWIIDHPWLTWPAMPVAIYLELCSFVIAFRPALARWWAAVLVVFHVGNYFTMTIAFPPSCFLLALFFFRSPFDPGRASWRTLIFGVPVFGDVLQWILQSRQQSSDEVVTGRKRRLAKRRMIPQQAGETARHG